MKNLFCIILLATSFFACGKRTDNQSDKIISVSIPPLKSIVEAIVGDDFEIETLLPSGVAPESYSPTISQLLNLENSEFLFTTGLLDFEHQIFNNLHLPSERIINLSNSIDIITDSTHIHKNTPAPDPHIWLSPLRLKTIASNVYNAIHSRFPDSAKYQHAYLKLIDRIDSTHLAVLETVNNSPQHMFIIYHPALSYFAKDYNLVQLAVENNGKEPSALHIQNIVSTASDNNIKVVLYQSEFPQSVVEVIAADIGAVTVEFNPLNENILDEILNISHIICDL